MPFSELSYRRNPFAEARESMASIGYRRFVREGVKAKRDSLPRLIIGLPLTLVKQIDHEGRRFVFLLGDGEDAGKAHIVTVAKNRKDGVEPHTFKGGAFALRFGYIPYLGDDAAEKEFVETKLIEPVAGNPPRYRGVEIKLPAWFKQAEGS